MMPPQRHLDYLTLIHPHATKLSIKQLYTKYQLHKYCSFAEKKHFGGHIGGRLMFFYDVSPSLFKILYSSIL